MRLMLTALTLALAACADDRAPAANKPGNAAAEATPAESKAAAARIPANFRGLWAEDRAACAQLSHPSRLIISERVIRYPSFVLVSEGVDAPTQLSIAVKGLNQRTGAPAEAHFSIDATGSILTDEAGGGAVRTRCQ